MGLCGVYLEIIKRIRRIFRKKEDNILENIAH